MLRRYQRLTPRLLPAGATVAGWVSFLPLDQRALSTAHEFCGLAGRSVWSPELAGTEIRKSEIPYGYPLDSLVPKRLINGR